jgi:hypothetical protein
MVNSSGASLLYSTYLGGSDADGGRTIVADGGGKAVIAGNTSSADFPLSGTPFDPSYNGTKDAFIAKLLISEMFLVPFGSLDNGNANIANIGASAANVTLSIIESSGAVVGNKNFSIPTHGVIRSWDQIGNIFDFGKPVTLAITADQPLIGDNIKWAGPPYDTVGAGFTCAPLGLMKGKEFYFPFSSFGGWANAYCVIANVAAQDALVTIQLTDSGGALRRSTSFNLPARSVVRSWDYIGSIQAIADPALLRITSDKEVVVEAVRWEENTRGWGFAIFPASVGTGTGFAVPFGSLDNGNINLGNTGAGPANVTLTIRDPSGDVVGTESITIPALGVVRTWDVIGNIYNYGKPLTVEIASNQPLAADNIKWAGPPYETVGAGFSCGPLDLMKGRTFYFPFSSFAAWTNAYCVIANTTDQPLDGGIGIFDSAGVLRKSASFSIGPRGVVRGWDIIGSIQAAADPALVLVVTTKEAVLETVRWEENRRGWGFAVLPAVK